MVSRTEVGQDHGTRVRWRLGKVSFALIAITVEIATVVGLSIATGALYHTLAYGGAGMVDLYARVGFLVALLFVLPFLFRNEYQFHDYLKGRKSLGRITWIWGVAFASLAVIGFMTKTTGTYSRGWVAMFIVLGPIALCIVTGVIRQVLQQLIEFGRVIPRRFMLIGDSNELERFEQQITATREAVRVISSVVLPYRGLTETDTKTLGELQSSLDATVAKARALHIDDVIIFSEWSNSEFADRAVAAFSVLPAAIHVGASDLIGRFRNARVWRFGDVTTVSLTVPPLTVTEAFTKRTFDICVSATALMLLAPAMALIAAIIKWDSAGPVFFRQRRRGFNHEEFKIFKFRTMTTLDDGDTIIQAQTGDERLTEFGRFLRRWNLDELPQLINVLKGEMSLVGPRPHAVAHDKIYERRLVTYPRRLNMRPGMTGWAQVHGYRGATDSDESMQRRLDYDLYYIDNWSVWLDLHVLWLTVFSPKAYRNAV